MILFYVVYYIDMQTEHRSMMQRMEDRKQLLVLRRENNERKLRNIITIKENMSLPISDLERLRANTLREPEINEKDLLFTNKSTTNNEFDLGEKKLFENISTIADKSTATKIYDQLLIYLSEKQVKTVNVIWATIKNKGNKQFSKGISISAYVDFVITQVDDYENATVANTIAPQIRKDVADAKAQKIIDDKIQDDIDEKARQDKAELLRLQKIQDDADEAERIRLQTLAQQKINDDEAKAKVALTNAKNANISRIKVTVGKIEKQIDNTKNELKIIDDKINANNEELEDKEQELADGKYNLSAKKKALRTNVGSNERAKNEIINDEVFNDGVLLVKPTGTYKKHNDAMIASQTEYDKLIDENKALKIRVKSENKKLNDENKFATKILNKQIIRMEVENKKLDALKNTMTGLGFENNKVTKKHYKKQTNFVGKGSDVNNKQDRYAQLGKNMINVDALRKDNMLIVKYIKNRNLIPDFPKQKVSSSVALIILDFIKFDKIDNMKYESLNNSDKLTLVNFLNASHIEHNIYGVQSKEQIYKVLIGELTAGNNSENIKQTLKKLIEESLIAKEITINQALKVINKFDL